MSAYVTPSEVEFLGSMPAEDIAALSALYPGIVERMIVAVSGMFDSRLRKRYQAPFSTPFPEALKLAVSAWVAYRLWLKLGFHPSSEHNEAIQLDYTEAKSWLEEAANGETGLVELPRREQPLGPGAVNAGGPLGYSETSPYLWTTLQRETGRGEDRRG